MTTQDVSAGKPINFPYTATDLTDAIDLFPNVWGLLGELNVFPEKEVSSTLVEIQFRDGVITLLPAVERGGEPSVATSGSESSFFLKIPHFPHLDKIVPEDLQDKFAFGMSLRKRKTLDDVVAERLFAINQKYKVSWEYLRVGALRGEIIDGKGEIQHNLYDVFDVERKTISLGLDDEHTDVEDRCYEVSRHMEDNLLGEVMDGVQVIASKELFKKFRTHRSVRETFLNWNSGLGQRDVRKHFEFGGLVWREYNAVAPNVQGVPQRFIPAGKGYAYPLGTMNTFVTYLGPANMISTVNTLGRRLYVSPEILKHGKGVELFAESNPLPLCKRPILVVELTE